MIIQKPYLLFLGDAVRAAAAKTGFGLRDWCPESCLGQWALPDCTVDLGLPRLNPREAVAAGAKSMVIAVAPVGGPSRNVGYRVWRRRWKRGSTS